MKPETKSVYKVHSWTIKTTRKGLEMPYENTRHFFDFESAEEQFKVQKSKVSFEIQNGKNLKGFVTLQECKGIVGEISVGTELKRAEL